MEQGTSAPRTRRRPSPTRRPPGHGARPQAWCRCGCPGPSTKTPLRPAGEPQVAPAHRAGADDDGGVAPADRHLAAEGVAAELAVDLQVDPPGRGAGARGWRGRRRRPGDRPARGARPAEIERGAALGGAIQVADAPQALLHLALAARSVSVARSRSSSRSMAPAAGEDAHLGLGIAAQGEGLGGALELAGLLEARGPRRAPRWRGRRRRWRAGCRRRGAPSGPGPWCAPLALGALGGLGAEGDPLLDRGLGVGAEEEHPRGVVAQPRPRRRAPPRRPDPRRSPAPRASFARRLSRFDLERKRSNKLTRGAAFRLGSAEARAISASAPPRLALFPPRLRRGSRKAEARAVPPGLRRGSPRF